MELGFYIKMLYMWMLMTGRIPRGIHSWKDGGYTLVLSRLDGYWPDERQYGMVSEKTDHQKVYVEAVHLFVGSILVIYLKINRTMNDPEWETIRLYYILNNVTNNVDTDKSNLPDKYNEIKSAPMNTCICRNSMSMR